MKKIAYLLLTISFCGLTACKTGTKKGGNMDNETLVKIETTLGDIKVKLYNETPKHRDNFIKMWVTHFRLSLYIRSIFTKKVLCRLPVRETM